MDAAYATEPAERRDRLREQLVGIGDGELGALLPKPRAPRAGKAGALPVRDWELRAAHGLLQPSCFWSDSKWCAEKRDGLEERCHMATGSHIPGPETVAKTLRRLREGIPDGRRRDKTDATAEGPDDTIKPLEKNAYGRRSFAP